MQVNRKNAAAIRGAIDHWAGAGQLDEATAAALRGDIEVLPFDWKNLVRYSFWAALACIVIAIGAVFADQALIALLQALFDALHLAKCAAFAILAAGFYWLGTVRRRRHPKNIFSNEAILFLGVLATAGAVYQLGRAFDTASGHFSLLLLLSFLIYAVLGFAVRSRLIWLFALISLGGWMGAETGYVSGWGAYYLGMNYPLRFVLFGGVLTAVALSLEQTSWFHQLSRTTLATGLAYLFIALWILSIFGNHGDEVSWRAARQIELFHYSLLFAAAAAAAIWHGLRHDDAMTKGFGLTFLFINLYTRFFEYCWDTTHKAVFFGLLAISLWYLGSRAEKIWHGHVKNFSFRGR